MAYAQILDALSDPTRRAIVDALRLSPQPVGALAQQFPISRPAISQHLKVLSDAGLVAAQPEGTRRVYRLKADGLEALRDYLDNLWDDALASYAREAQRQSRKGPLDV